MFTKTYQPIIPEQLIGEVQRKTAHELVEKAKNNVQIPPQLFVGPSGCGKTTVAKMVANTLNPVEITHYNCGDLTGVSDAREVVENWQNRPLYGGYKVYIFDEVHRLSTAAQDAFLIPLDDIKDLGLSHLVVFAATTSLNKVQDTFKSRFEPHQFTPPPFGEMRRLMRSIAKAENITLTNDDYGAIVNAAVGNIRNLVTYLEQFSRGTISFTQVEDPNPVNFIQLLKSRDIVGLVSIEDDYNSLLYKASLYALKAIQGGNQDYFYQKVLLQFGEFFINGQNLDKVTFAALMVRFINE